MRETLRFLPETPADAAVVQLSALIEQPSGEPARPTVPLWADHLMQACGHCRAGFHFEEGGCFGFAVALHEELSKIQPCAQIGMSQEFAHCVVLLGPLAVDHQGDRPLEHAHKYAPLAGLAALYAAAAAAGHSRDDVDGDVAWAREVIGAAKSLCVDAHVNAEHPLVLTDCDAIASHIDATTPDGIDTEMAREIFFGTQAVLVNVPTAFVEPDSAHADNHIEVRGRTARYKKLPAETAPPILLGENGLISDGHHRHRAAVARKDPWMLAYQVIGADIDLGLTPTPLDPSVDPQFCTGEQVAMAKLDLAAWRFANSHSEHPSHLALEGQCDVFARVFSEHLEKLGIPHGISVIQRFTSFDDGREDDENLFSHAVICLPCMGREIHLDAQGAQAIEAFQSAWIDAQGESTEFERGNFADREAFKVFLTNPIEGYGAPKSNTDDTGSEKSWGDFFKAIRAKQRPLSMSPSCKRGCGREHCDPNHGQYRIATQPGHTVR